MINMKNKINIQIMLLNNLKAKKHLTKLKIMRA